MDAKKKLGDKFAVTDVRRLPPELRDSKSHRKAIAARKHVGQCAYVLARAEAAAKAQAGRVKAAKAELAKAEKALEKAEAALPEA